MHWKRTFLISCVALAIAAPGAAQSTRRYVEPDSVLCHEAMHQSSNAWLKVVMKWR